MRLDGRRISRSPTRLAVKSKAPSSLLRYEAATACGHLQTQAPDWFDEARAKAIDSMDTSILLHNQLNVYRVIATLVVLRCFCRRVVDHAGGCGVLVQLLRDACVDAYWQDKYCGNLLVRGFEADDHCCGLVAAFEIFEHFEHPTQDLRATLQRTPHALLSTELIPGPADPDPSWWYLGAEHGQHIGFFRRASLERMARDAGCHLGTDGRRLHLFSQRPISAIWRALVATPTLTRWTKRLSLRSKTMNDFASMRNRADLRRSA